jgi:poly(3-hydroxybutyrate) depolymerase
MKAILSVAMAGALAGALFSPSAAFSAPRGDEKLPDVKTLETTVPVYDPMKGIALGIEGLYERTVAGTGGRTAKIYASKDAYIGSYVVVLNTPENEETVSWLAESGWLRRADRERLVLYVLEPDASGRWGTAAEEQPYIETAFYDFADSRGNYYQPSESYYVVGYDTPGSVLQRVVMKDPILVAAAAFVDASDIDQPFLESTKTDFYPTPDWNGAQVPSSEVPMPVWIVNTERGQQFQRVVEHWKSANETTDQGRSFEGGKIYKQRRNSLYGYVAESSRVAVAVLDDKSARVSERKKQRLDDKIYDFLSDYTRYGGNVGGNIVGSRPDYKRLDVSYNTLELDGRLREYLVYVSPKAKQEMKARRAVPAVLSFHGAGMTMHMMMDYSRWWEIADQEGFILVFPQSASNGRNTGWSTGASSNEFTYVQRVLDEVKADYRVDARRIYLNGQSSGSNMTQAIGRNLALSKNFTAIGSTSFATSSTNVDGEVLPFMQLFGEFDFWPWQPSTSPVGPMLNYWINRNDALGTPTTPSTTVEAGRRTIWSWENAQGVEVVKYGVTFGRGHSIISEEMPVLWEWFENWKKNGEGENVYVGP